MKLNIGGGGVEMAGWINVDMDGGMWPNTHCVAEAGRLPFQSGTVDRVFYCHVLEHMDYSTTAHYALLEARRVLKPTGEFGLVGPAMDLAEALLAETGRTEDGEWLLSAIRKHGDPPHGHAWTATSEDTLALVRTVFDTAQLIGVEEMMRWNGWPNDVPSRWQVAVRSGVEKLTVAEKAAGRDRARLVQPGLDTWLANAKLLADANGKIEP